MRLVEPEAEGPIEGEEAIVTAPRPPHRRVSVSFLFTLTVLIGTVVAIYLIFPARHNVLLTEAMERHQEENPDWELTAPINHDELRGWALGVAGKGVPMPPESVKIIAARAVKILDRRAAVIRIAVGNDELTYLAQHARGMSPNNKRAERTDDDLHAASWRSGKFTCVIVGPAATSQTWLAQVRPPK